MQIFKRVFRPAYKIKRRCFRFSYGAIGVFDASFLVPDVLMRLYVIHTKALISFEPAPFLNGIMRARHGNA